jgi:hypothetical protein
MDPACSPIFVVGTGRSGTTLLRFMLSAHPRIYITHEASFYVWESFFSRSAPRRAFLDYYFQTFSFRWLRVDPARVLEGLPDPLPAARSGAAFAAIMREKAAQYGRVRYGDKTPAHSGHLRRIFSDFPDARVIHIVRDPRAVALSLARMPWACASLYANAHASLTDLEQVARFRDRVLRIRLEDLLADPRATMGRVLDHVGEPWDDAVLDHARHIPDPKDMPPLPWLESAARDRGAASTPWRTLPAVQIRMIERTARRVMDELGYEPARLDESPGRLATWWAGVRQLPAWLQFLGAYFRLGLWLRDPRHFDDPRTSRLWRDVNPGAWAHYPGFEIPLPPALPAKLLGPA